MQLENIVDFLPQNDELVNCSTVWYYNTLMCILCRDVVAVAPVISSQVAAELKIENDTAPVVLVFTTYPVMFMLYFHKHFDIMGHTIR